MNNTPKTNGKNVYSTYWYTEHDSDIPDELYN